MELVLDTGVLLAACLGRAGFEPLGDHDLVAVDLVGWEAVSVLHEFVWRLGRGMATPQCPGLALADFQGAFQNLKGALDPTSPLHRVGVHAFDPRLADEAWLVAERCGFAKVYDAASIALARLRGCRLVTLDARLAAGPAQRLATVIGPAQV